MSLENIISKFLLNKTDQQELEQLQAWQAEAQDNVQALQEMQKIFALDMSGYKSYDTQNAWDKVESQISNEESPKESEDKVFRLKRMIMSAAAVITLIAASTIVWQNYTSDPYPTHYASSENIQTAELPDQSIVQLDKGASLDLVSDDYKANRALSLQGRAFFEVAKDADHPFTVELPQGKITVLGTQFNITAQDNLEEIYVTEGHVRYDIDERSFDLKAGDFIKVLDGDVIKVEMNDEHYLSWKRGKLVLKDVSISAAMKSLSTHFQSNITIIPDLDVTKCKISTTIDQETLSDALEELTILLSLQYKMVDGNVLITDIKC